VPHGLPNAPLKPELTRPLPTAQDVAEGKWPVLSCGGVSEVGRFLHGFAVLETDINERIADIFCS
jgi:hypothetical protein